MRLILPLRETIDDGIEAMQRMKTKQNEKR